MSTAEILAEIPKLSSKDRRRLLERILELEDETAVLESMRRMADESFQILDAMEAEDAGANPGEVWIIDLGMVAKIRPCLILSDYPNDDELALIVVIPHTTAVRNNRWEVRIAKNFLKDGVFHLQQLQSLPIVRLQKKIGVLAVEEFQSLRAKLSELLHLT